MKLECSEWLLRFYIQCSVGFFQLFSGPAGDGYPHHGGHVIREHLGVSLPGN